MENSVLLTRVEELNQLIGGCPMYKLIETRGTQFINPGETVVWNTTNGSERTLLITNTDQENMATVSISGIFSTSKAVINNFDHYEIPCGETLDLPINPADYKGSKVNILNATEINSPQIQVSAK